MIRKNSLKVFREMAIDLKLDLDLMIPELYVWNIKLYVYTLHFNHV